MVITAAAGNNIERILLYSLIAFVIIVFLYMVAASRLVRDFIMVLSFFALLAALIWYAEYKLSVTEIAPTLYLSSVTMTGTDEGWAGGYRCDGTTILTTHPGCYDLILHYDGEHWSEQMSNPVFDAYNVYGDDAIKSIYMLSPYEGWALGNELHGWHYAGSRWQQLRIGVYNYTDTPPDPNPSPGVTLLSSTITGRPRAVFMLSPTDGWAVGSAGGIWHYQQADWQPVNSPLHSSLNSLSMTSAADGWAVGVGGEILHYAGTGWQAQPSPVSTTLSSIYMSAPTGGWAVGDDSTLYNMTAAPGRK